MRDSIVLIHGAKIAQKSGIRRVLCSEDTPLPTAHSEFITLACIFFLPFCFRKNKLLDTNSWGRYGALELFIFVVEIFFLCELKSDFFWVLFLIWMFFSFVLLTVALKGTWWLALLWAPWSERNSPQLSFTLTARWISWKAWMWTRRSSINLHRGSNARVNHFFE